MRLIKFLISALCITYALITVGCTSGDKFDYNQKVILITGTEKDQVTTLAVESTPVSYTITATATDKVAQDATVQFTYDSTAIDAYNVKNNTKYFSIPSANFKLDTTVAVITAGKAASSPIKVTLTSTTGLVDGRTYVIPISIKSVTGTDMTVLPASKTIFLRLARTLTFNCLNLAGGTSGSLYSNFIFTDAQAVSLSTFTYEVKCFANAWHASGSNQISRLCAFEAKDESKATMLRFGEIGQDVNCLQWVSPAGSLYSNTRFNTNTWYLLSMVYDGSKFTLYVNGVKDVDMSGSASGIVFQRFEIGMSYQGYYSSQYFNGRMSEARVWNRALSAKELALGVCGVDPASPGLVAYWKFNQTSGKIIPDATGHGYDMNWANSQRAVSGDALTATNYNLTWITADSYNKCAQ